ncbi:hypothetical protein [Pararhizobium sp. PWRC1-1]|uniref:hypothetical protein n=1 Tax=Pararhizobium sp. PWRC1-1 TaxID=2804566 RepID=UPI003CFB0AD7
MEAEAPAQRLNDKLIKRLPFTQGNHAFITDTINKNLKLVVSSSQKVFFFAHPGAVIWRIGVFPAAGLQHRDFLSKNGFGEELTA